MLIEYVNYKTIKPYDKNAKKHPKEQILKISNSIKEFGFNQPIVVDKDNVIIVGHGRYEASKILNLEQIPILRVNLTEEKAKSYRLADNTLNESDWDISLVIDELKGLSDEMLDLTGFEKDLINKESINDTDLDLKEIYKIEIECDNFEDQELKYEQLILQGYKCRLLNL